MHTALESHPETALLAAFRCGSLDAEQREAVRLHLAGCPACVLRLASGRHRALVDHRPAEAEAGDVPAPLVNHPRYRILGKLGEGGMGVVYRAEHRLMGRIVALKVMSARTVSSNATAIDRFRREVRLASRLNHPNIVAAYDADEAGGLHFLVMEYVDGSSLDRVLHDRGPLPVEEACGMARQAALGLHHAFERGMIHRDIKPHNLMLASDGVVKILDFGLARLAAADGADAGSTTAMAITAPQTVVGTPDFLSPEQARSTAGLDIRSDLYSLGCTLYFLLTGRPPFGGIGAYAKMIAHFKEPAPDLCEVRPEAPGELSEVIQKLMAKSPDERYRTPLETAAALEPFARVGPESGRLQLDDVPSCEEDCEETRRTCPTNPSFAILPTAQELPSAPADCPPDAEETSSTSSECIQLSRRRKRRIVFMGGLAAACLGAGALANVLTHPSRKPADDPPSANQNVAVSPTHLVPAIVEAPPAGWASSGRRKQVLLLVPHEFAYSELGAVIEAVKAQGATPITASAERRRLEGYRYGKAGLKTLTGYCVPDYALKEVSPAFLDAVDAVIVLPGATHAFVNQKQSGPEVKLVLDRALQKHKILGGIGSGIYVLGAHHLLENAAVSSLQNRPQLADLVKVKAWLDEPRVVIDLPFVTAAEFSQTAAIVNEVLRSAGRSR